MVSYAFGDRVDKIFVTLAIGLILAAMANGSQLNKMGNIDLFASCVILTGWAVYFLPGLMNTLNIYLLKDIFLIFFKLWSVDILFNMYAYVRGYGSAYTYVMDDGWFFATTGFIRAALIVSCVVVSTISYITKEIQRQRSKRIILARLNQK